MSKMKKTAKKTVTQPKASSSHRETAQKRRQAAFLEAYITCATITHAARMAKIAKQTHYDWIAVDKEYQLAFAEAEIAATDTLIQEARRRAVQGVSEPVFYKGKEIKTVQKYSDALLMFLLKGALPEVFRERYEISGGNKPIRVKSDPGRETLADDTLKALITFGEQLRRAQRDRGGKSPE